MEFKSSDTDPFFWFTTTIQPSLWRHFFSRECFRTGFAFDFLPPHQWLRTYLPIHKEFSTHGNCRLVFADLKSFKTSCVFLAFMWIPAMIVFISDPSHWNYQLYALITSVIIWPIVFLMNACTPVSVIQIQDSRLDIMKTGWPCTYGRPQATYSVDLGSFESLEITCSGFSNDADLELPNEMTEAVSTTEVLWALTRYFKSEGKDIFGDTGVTIADNHVTVDHFVPSSTKGHMLLGGRKNWKVLTHRLTIVAIITALSVMLAHLKEWSMVYFCVYFNLYIFFPAFTKIIGQQIFLVNDQTFLVSTQYLLSKNQRVVEVDDGTCVARCMYKVGKMGEEGLWLQYSCLEGCFVPTTEHEEVLFEQLETESLMADRQDIIGVL